MKAILHRRLALPVLAALVTSAVVAAVGVAGNGNGNGNGKVGNGNGNDPPVTTGAPIGQLVLQTGGTAIPILSYSIGAANPQSLGSGGGGGAGKVDWSSFNFMKAVDANSTGLLTAVSTGTHFPKITATLQWGTGASAVTWVYEFETASIESVQQSGAGGSTPLESVALTFAKVTWKYTNAAGTTSSGSWDLVHNTP